MQPDFLCLTDYYFNYFVQLLNDIKYILRDMKLSCSYLEAPFVTELSVEIEVHFYHQ